MKTSSAILISLAASALAAPAKREVDICPANETVCGLHADDILSERQINTTWVSDDVDGLNKTLSSDSKDDFLKSLLKRALELFAKRTDDDVLSLNRTEDALNGTDVLLERRQNETWPDELIERQDRPTVTPTASAARDDVKREDGSVCVLPRCTPPLVPPTPPASNDFVKRDSSIGVGPIQTPPALDSDFVKRDSSIGVGPIQTPPALDNDFGKRELSAPVGPTPTLPPVLPPNDVVKRACTPPVPPPPGVKRDVDACGPPVPPVPTPPAPEENLNERAVPNSGPATPLPTSQLKARPTP